MSNEFLRNETDYKYRMFTFVIIDDNSSLLVLFLFVELAVSFTILAYFEHSVLCCGQKFVQEL